jgi:hypothetical protein
MRLSVIPPVAPMLAKPVSPIPADQYYEPRRTAFGRRPAES